MINDEGRYFWPNYRDYNIQINISSNENFSYEQILILIATFERQNDWNIAITKCMYQLVLHKS
jgi:hypothetical protein